MSYAALLPRFGRRPALAGLILLLFCAFVLTAVPASAAAPAADGASGVAGALPPASGPGGATMTADGAIAAAWRGAKDAGSYRLKADLEMGIDPEATAAGRGQSARQLDWRMDGDIELAGRSYLRLRAESADYRSKAIELFQAGGQTFVRRDGRLELTDNPAGIVSPTSDFLGYLAAAKDAVVVERAADGRPTHITFAVDGPRFARHVAEEMRRQMAGQVPDGVAMAPPEVLNRTSGTGELWLDEEGLPRRQSLELSLPAVNAAYGGRARIVADFFDFGLVRDLPEPVSDGNGGWTLDGAAPPVDGAGLGVAGGTTGGTGAAMGDLTGTMGGTVEDIPIGEGDAGGQEGLAADLESDVSSSNALASTSALERRLDRLVAGFGRALDRAATAGVRGGAPAIGVLVLALAVLWVVLSGRRRKLAVYATMVSLVSVSIVGSPLLRAFQIDSFMTKQALAAEKRTDLVSEMVGNEPAALAARMAAAVQAQTGSTAIAKCGDGSQTADTDRDGLTDFKEGCLGTDPFSVDTDGDAITDTLELEGFTLGSRRWTGDPFKVDSNGDGRGDLDEWAKPNGLAESQDIDGDGTPNLWDGDDDGDAVPDLADLSPDAYSGYLDHFSLETQGGGFDGYEYIQVQVQPQNSAHWRYSLSTLDWPHDDLGTMKDLDDSTNDLQLVPMLEVTTDDKPSADLAARYNVITAGKLYIPLLPENDGGKITAFRAKVAYEPLALASIDWSSARFLWVTTGRSDSYAGCVNPGAPGVPDCRFRSHTEVLTSYPESFRLTGLQVTKSGPFEALMMGTPTSPTEDVRLFGLAFGLNGSYMKFDSLFNQSTAESSLAEVEQRVTSPNTPITLTWGVSTTAAAPVAAERHVYGHMDQGIAFTNGQVVPAFLQREYTTPKYAAGGLCRDAQGTQFRCASLLGAYEFKTGSYDLARLGSGQVNAGSVAVQLSSISLATQRSVKMSMYEHNPISGWQAMSPARMMELLFVRYGGNLDAILAQIRAAHPDRDLTAHDLQYGLVTLYMAWTSGQSRVTALDGVPLSSSVSDNNAAEDELAAQITASALTATRTALNFPGLFSDLTEGIKDSFGLTKLTGTVPDAERGIQFRQRAIYGLIAVTATAATLGSIALAIAGAVCASKGPDACDQDALQAANYTFASLALVDSLRSGAVAVKDLRLVRQAAALRAASDTSDAAQATMVAAREVSTVSKGAKAMAVVGLIIDLAIVWTVFGLTLDHANGNPMIISVAIATVVVATIFAVALFVLSLFVPVGTVISAILGLIDAVLSIATGGEWSITVVLVKLFFDVKLLTEIEGLNFLDFRVELRDSDAGSVVGNTYQVKDSFRGDIVPTGHGNSDDAGDSHTSASLHGIAPTPADVQAADQNLQEDCVVEDRRQTCRQEVGVGFTLKVAKPNVAMQVTKSVRFTVRYAECGLFGSVCLIRKSINDGFSIPDTGNDSKDDDEPIKLHFDVLPATAEGLWTMPALTVADRDLDTVPDATEAVTGTKTSPTNWDTDGDELSDGFETGGPSRAAGAHFRATDATLKDTDHDGLTDGQEFVRGTRADDDGDTDHDGLLDGQEVYHQDLADANANGNTAEWLGGWSVPNVTLPSGNTAFFYSDPALQDHDGDGMTDGIERGYGTSPYAFNSTPRVILNASPLAASEDGKTGLYFAPGQAVTATLSVMSYGVQSITRTLTACLPTFFTAVQGGTLGGDRTVAPTSGGCPGAQGYQWAFTPASPLTFGQVVSTTFNATVSAAITATTRGDGSASLPYQAGVLTDTLHFVVDADTPALSVEAPRPNALLRGQTASIEGTAADPTSWIDAVEVIPGGGGYVPATGRESWSYLWPLPAVDGPYTLNVRSRDPFGHTSAVTSIPVTVDNTPPVVTMAQAASVVTGDTVIPLGGTVADATSGVERVQLSIDRRPWRTVALTSTNSVWSFDWTPGGDSAQGEHTIGVRAFDRAGNQSADLNTTVVVDRLAPTDNLTTKQYLLDPPHVKPSQATTLRGFANDAGRAPLPPRPAALHGTLDGVDDATVWLSPKSARDDDGGVKAMWLGDANGDGRADLALGLPGADGGKGRVAILRGRAGDFPIPADVEALSASPNSLVGAPASGAIAAAGIGGMLAAAGDVNADGFGDLLVGDGPNKRVFLVFGRPSDLGADLALDREHAGTWTVINLPAAPTRVAAAGDVNGDGFDDVFVVAGGQAYLVANTRQSWPASIVAADDAAAQLPLPAAGVVTGVGDVNGDQLDDFVATDPTAANGPAGVYLFLGRTTFAEGTHTALALVVNATNALAVLGGTLPGQKVAALGDVNGDAKTDFLYSATGGPRLVFGRTGGAWSVDRTLGGYNPPADGFLAAPGDVNADGFNDMLLGTTAGKAYLILGGASLPATPPVEATLEGVAGAASAPYTTGADLNCDASADLLLIPADASVTPLAMAALQFEAPARVDAARLERAGPHPLTPSPNAGRGGTGGSVPELLLPPLSQHWERGRG